MPSSQKHLRITKKALEIAEDEYFSKLADDRDHKNNGFISHEEFWSKVFGSHTR